MADDGPAFQRALDALAAAGGGTLFVPAGSYLIATPVFKDFSTVPNASVIIQGVPSTTMPAPPTAQGQDLAEGLDLTSEIIPATGESQSALTLTNIRQLLVEHIGFSGRPEQMTDAFITLYLIHIDQAVVRHCEFYGISSFGLVPGEGGGNMVRAVDCDLSIELSVFLGCTANSGAYAPVVENLLWRKFTMTNSIFLDYGLRAFFSKTGLGAPLSWIDIGNPAPPTPASPRREFVVRDTFLDEGGWVGISAFPRRWGPPERIDLVYISGLKMNVANMGTTGHRLYNLENLLIENSHYGWSHNAYAAIDVNQTANVILDKLTCIDHADRIFADAGTGRLTVINSQYNGLDSLAQVTTVLNTTPEDDPVQYVRQRFLSALGRQPDPAAHFYWSDILIMCGQDSNCLNEKRSALTAYLNTDPQPNFSITGTVLDENGEPTGGVNVNLSGSQSVATITDEQGGFQFSNLPTIGTYTLAVSKQHYAFIPSSQTITRPAANVAVSFNARLNRHSISGQITRGNGTAIGGVTVRLDQSTVDPVTTDSNGSYSFSEVPAGQNYTVVPSLTDFAFSPSSITFNDLSADKTAHFGGVLTHVSIAGNVVDESGNPLGDVDVSLTGSQVGAQRTDSLGNFRFTSLPVSGTYTVAISKRDYTFATSSQTFDQPADHRSVVFNGRLNRHSIGGRITRANGTGIDGVTVQLANTSVAPITTDSNGNYSFAELAAGQNYTIVPSSTDFDFIPGTSTLLDLSTDKTANFTGNLSHVSIGGTVVDEVGNPLRGADVVLSGSQSAAAVTDSQGAFQLSRLPVTGTYTVAVSKRHYSFATGSQTFIRPSDYLIVAFSGRLNRHSISGRITWADGSAVSGLTLQLTQSAATVVTTDSNGYYLFAELPAGQSYAVVPIGFVFAPVNANFNDLATSQTANFVGGLRPELLRVETTQLAVALDSISFVAQPFSIFSSFGLNPDGLTRVTVFAKNLGEVASPSQISIVAQDDEGHTYPLEIEYFGTIPGQNWLKQLNVKLSSNLLSGRCVQLRLSVAGVNSNNAQICIAAAGGSSR